MDVGTAWEGAGLLGLFVASFLAATVLPFSSEAILAGMTLGPWSTGSLFFAATLGNWLGGMSSYALGRLGDMQRLARWMRVDGDRVRAWEIRVARHGAWLALLCWAPIVGDMIAVALGLFRGRWLPVAWWMLLGKAARYAVVLAALR